MRGFCYYCIEGGEDIKSSGIVRRIDELGRIVVPIEMRRALDIGERETMEISVEGDGIVLRRVHVGCVFCDGNKDISAFRGKNICAKCRRELQKT